MVGTLVIAAILIFFAFARSTKNALPSVLIAAFLNSDRDCFFDNNDNPVGQNSSKILRLMRVDTSFVSK